MSKRSRFLREENNELEKGLSQDTYHILTDIVVYIRSGNISDYSQELVRRDITQMLLDGEKRGLSAAAVVGEDYKAFCDAVISEMPQLSTAQRILTSVRDVLPAICCAGVIWLIFSLIGQIAKGEDWTHIPLTLSELIAFAAFVLLADMIVVYITKNSFNASTKTPVLPVLVLIVIFAAVLMLIGEMVSMTLMTPHIGAVIAVIILLAAAYKLIDESID